MGITKPQFTFRLDEDLIAKIRAYAKEENRSLPNYVETVLKAHVKEKEDKNA